MANVEEVRSQAMALSPDERSTLVLDLLNSLETLPTEELLSSDWEEELISRSDDYRSGTAPARPWQESVEHFRKYIHPEPPQ